MAESIEKSDGLTGKQRAFIDAYLSNGFNATAAARAAGYTDNEFTHTNANKLLQNTTIRAEIEKRFADLHMGSDEVLARLATMARGDISPFINDDGSYDLGTEQAKANLNLIKKSKVRMRHGTNPQGQDWEEVETEIELHDPKDALVQIGRHLKLFTDKVEVDDNLTDEQRAERIARILNTARARRDRQANGTTVESDP